MTIHSDHSKDTYLKALKKGMDSRWMFLTERTTGFFLGPFFCVTYHSGWEWNRKITNEKNTAIGIVRKEENGCRISFRNIKGLLAPHYLLGIWLLIAACLCILTPTPEFRRLALLISIPLTPLYAGLTTLFQSMTERSDEGEQALISILWDPVKLFSHRFNP